jgi:hypothetical protein
LAEEFDAQAAATAHLVTQSVLPTTTAATVTVRPSRHRT